MNIWSKVHDYLSDSCWDVSLSGTMLAWLKTARCHLWQESLNLTICLCDTTVYTVESTRRCATSTWQFAGEKVAMQLWRDKKILPDLTIKEIYNFCNDKWCNNLFHNSTGDYKKKKSLPLQGKLLWNVLIWGLPLSHPSEIPTGKSPLSLCSDKCNIWTTWWRLSWAESLNTFHWCLETLPCLPAYMCVCVFVWEAFLYALVGTKKTHHFSMGVIVHTIMIHNGWFTSRDWCLSHDQ